MPYQNVPDELQDQMESCVQKVMEKGQDKEAAIAICYTSVVEGKALPLEFQLDSVKVGARNNKNDKKVIREIRMLAKQITEKSLEVEPSDEDEMPDEMETGEMMASYGKAVKALGDGKIAGYLVTFKGLDATGEYFDVDTDFGEPSKLPVMYHHGMDRKIGKKRISVANVRNDEVGIWAETQLDLHDKYMAAIYKLAEQGALGWSSGAAAHSVEYGEDGKIKQWFLAEASLTPTPAEPRNMVSVKSLEVTDIEQPDPIDIMAIVEVMSKTIAEKLVTVRKAQG